MFAIFGMSNIVHTPVTQADARVALRLPQCLLDELRRAAAADSRSVSGYIVAAVRGKIAADRRAAERERIAEALPA